MSVRTFSSVPKVCLATVASHFIPPAVTTLFLEFPGRPFVPEANKRVAIASWDGRGCCQARLAVPPSLLPSLLFTPMVHTHTHTRALLAPINHALQHAGRHRTEPRAGRIRKD